MERMEAIVSGKVQGVWFRDFVVGEATALGITGTACNLPDGTVEVIAEGPEEKLGLLLERLKEGPPLARVSAISHTMMEATGAFPDFCIVHK